MKSNYLKIIELVLCFCSVALQAQESNFNSWTQGIIAINEKQKVQDSTFLCLCLTCETPTPIEEAIKKLSCFPVGLFGDIGQYTPYCSGNFKRLPFHNINDNLIPLLFYIEADRDNTKSLVMATFTKNGLEISSKVLASDDSIFLMKNKPDNSNILKLFQYILDNDVLYVRECCYNYELNLVNVITSAYCITYDGTIMQMENFDTAYCNNLLNTFELVEKWQIK